MPLPASHSRWVGCYLLFRGFTTNPEVKLTLFEEKVIGIIGKIATGRSDRGFDQKAY